MIDASLRAMTGSDIITTMVFALLVSAFVLVAAHAAEDAQRAANRSLRWIWAGAMALTLGLTVAAPVRHTAPPTALTTQGQPQVASQLPDGFPSTQAWRAAAVQLRDALGAPMAPLLQLALRAVEGVPFAVQRGLAVAWLLASAATFIAFATSYARLRRQVAQWPRHHFSSAAARIAPAAGPAVVGLAPSEIILPRWLLSRTAADQQVVIAHELAHVQARDPWLLMIACAMVACMPWNPLLWYALRRLRLAVELDCDRRVLRQGVRTEAYGALLIEISALRPAFPPAMPAFSCNSSFLERRLVAMTSRPSRFASARRIVGGLVTTLALFAACESKLPTSAEVDRMDATMVERALVTGGTTRYVVDGQRVTELEAKAIGTEKIRSVAVSRLGDSLSEIAISTSSARLPVAVKGDHEVVLTGDTIVVVGQTRKREPSSLAEVVLRERPTSTAARTFAGLLVIDGRIAESSELQRIPSERIARVEVVKGQAAKTLYGNDPRSANGVILLTLKQRP